MDPLRLPRLAFVITLLAISSDGCTGGPVGPLLPAPESAVIDTMALRLHTAFLADDSLLGRETGSRGADLAALYIESACRALGLSPVSASYELPVPVAVASADNVDVIIQSGGDTLALHGSGDVGISGGTSTALRDFEGPAVFAGTEADILRGQVPHARGAAAITLGVLSPGPAADSLRAGGVGALIQLTGDSASFRSWREGSDGDVMFLDDSEATSSYYLNFPSVVLGARASRLVADRMRRSGSGMTVRLEFHLHERKLEARNVACRLAGAAMPEADSAIVFTAHYDHLGVGAPDARGDSIYNGFSDNAAGVAMLLAIAEAMGHASVPPRHTTVFLFFTGEEEGLLGSDYYVAHPAWPLPRTVGVINLDAGAPPARVWSWRIAGGDSARLGRLAVDVALTRGWSAVTSGPRANSDYYPFYREGVPAIFLVPGPAPYQGLSADSSQALRRRWDHYHQPADEWKPDFPFVGLARYAEYALLVAQALDRRGLPRVTR